MCHKWLYCIDIITTIKWAICFSTIFFPLHQCCLRYEDVYRMVSILCLSPYPCSCILHILHNKMIWSFMMQQCLELSDIIIIILSCSKHHFSWFSRKRNLILAKKLAFVVFPSWHDGKTTNESKKTNWHVQYTWRWCKWDSHTCQQGHPHWGLRPLFRWQFHSSRCTYRLKQEWLGNKTSHLRESCWTQSKASNLHV